MMLMNCKETDLMNRSKGHFQGRKDQVWLISIYFCILISVIELLPKCIASFSLSMVIIVLFYWF